MNLRVGIVGCGLMGARRAAAAAARGDRVTLVVDTDPDRAGAFVTRYGARPVATWEDLVTSPEVEAVVVATPNALLADVACAALAAHKHVLCEKPFGTNTDQAAVMLRAARSAETIVKVGFTLRHHEAIARAHTSVARGEIGTTLGIRAAYGHGGRAGYENEWRGSPALAGGGELLDQGVHLLDLARWFLGDFAEVAGAVGTWVWPVEPLEDNGFALLRTEEGRVASLHTSWTQWRNLFRLEVLGSEGLITVEGLGGSYGPERVVFAHRRPEGGVPDEWEWIVPHPESAWDAEWDDFVAAILNQRPPLTTAEDGYAAARLVDAVYASAAESGVIRLTEVAAA